MVVGEIGERREMESGLGIWGLGIVLECWFGVIGPLGEMCRRSFAMDFERDFALREPVWIFELFRTGLQLQFSFF